MFPTIANVSVSATEVPTAFTATTSIENVPFFGTPDISQFSEPAVHPLLGRETLQLREFAALLLSSALEVFFTVAMYEVIGDPPSSVDWAKVTVTLVVAVVASTAVMVGAVGTVLNVTAELVVAQAPA